MGDDSDNLHDYDAKLYVGSLQSQASQIRSLLSCCRCSLTRCIGRVPRLRHILLKSGLVSSSMSLFRPARSSLTGSTCSAMALPA